MRKTTVLGIPRRFGVLKRKLIKIQYFFMLHNVNWSMVSNVSQAPYYSNYLPLNNCTVPEELNLQEIQIFLQVCDLRTSV